MSREPRSEKPRYRSRIATPSARSPAAVRLQADRVRNIGQRIVEGDPAKALLEVAGSSPANLVVVGNRDLGVERGGVLTSIPREVVKRAACNVMVVQAGDGEDGTSARKVQTLDGDVRTPGQGG